MARKLIAFDLDDTLTVTKSEMSDRMGELLVRLLDVYEVCIISGGNITQFMNQIVSRLKAEPEQLTHLHLMPTSGTRYYRYSPKDADWKTVYADTIEPDRRAFVAKALEESAKELGLWEANPYGDIIEDRGSQVTFSALGQLAPPEEKYKWDPDGVKKHKLRDHIAPLVPDLEVRVGGSTSVDVTLIGIDKAYGISKLMEQLSLDKDEVLFIGDRLEEGGNDYPVKAMGIDTVAVERWEDTTYVIEGILSVSR